MSFKVAAILDIHTIAIKISKQETEKMKISVGDHVKVVANRLDIFDPDDEEETLGSYTTYKESLEVTDIQEKFLVAKKYKRSKSALTFSLNGSKELASINADYDGDAYADDTIYVGDEVDFFE